MRISDWSSDVCSSDLPSLPAIATSAHRRKRVLLHAPALKARAQARRHRAALDRIIDRRGARHVDRGADVADRPLAGDVADVEEGVDALRDARAGGDAEQRVAGGAHPVPVRSEEHTSELQSLMRSSYA